MTQQLSSSQLRAARALLNWSRGELATRTKIRELTIHRIENDLNKPTAHTQLKLRTALENAGIEFTERGVQWTQHQVKTLTGVDGLKTFFDDVWYVVQHSNDEIVICGVSEDYLEEKLGDYLNYHRTRMATHGEIRMRCLIEEGDPNVGASGYCHYRWQAKENFARVHFYVYGDKLAIIVTSGPEDPLILLINNRTITQAYRRQFEAMWLIAKEIPKKKKAA